MANRGPAVWRRIIVALTVSSLAVLTADDAANMSNSCCGKEFNVSVSRLGGGKTAKVRTKLVRDMKVPAKGFHSIEAAVEAAANRYNPDSIARDREHVGVILKKTFATGGSSIVDQFFYTHGVGRRGQDTIAFVASVPGNFDLVAIWHTHGNSKFSNKFFSASDTRTSKKLSKPFYLADYTGMLKVFNPNDEIRTVALRKGLNLRLPKGASRGTLIRDSAGEAIRIRTR